MTKESENYGEAETKRRAEAAIKKTLATPPKPFTPKAKLKVNHGPPTTKAERATEKRVDKTVIKRMRKR